MSKSLGNFVDLETIESFVDRYSMDAWRYYLVTQGPLGATDANFTAQKFHDIYNAHLSNTVGNCCSRVTTMIDKYFDGVVPCEYGGEDRIVVGDVDWPARCSEASGEWVLAMERFAIAQAGEIAMGLIRDVDLFINDTEPFKLARDESRRNELGAILYQCLEVLRIATIMLMPMMPEKMNAFHEAIGCSNIVGESFQPTLEWGGTKDGATVSKIALFPRVDQ
jgi:methionyl-tRNA synthetase